MIRRIYLKMTGPQILASVSSMLCLLIDSVVISRFLGVLPSTGQTALTISACVWSWIWWTRRCTICCSLIILNTNKDGEQEMLDTWWIYFSDGSFAQFAILEDSVVLFNEAHSLSCDL